MNKTLRTDLAIALLLVCLGVALRLGLQDYPNVSPVAALALFSGYLFRGRLTAVVVPLGILAVSDLYFGGYAPVVMATVYVLLSVPFLMGNSLRRLHTQKISNARVTGLTGLAGFCFAGLFFIGTNLAVWSTSSYYSNDFTGLLECYTAALPFFRQTLMGDLLFITLFFGSYALCRSLLASRVRIVVTQ